MPETRGAGRTGNGSDSVGERKANHRAIAVEVRRDNFDCDARAMEVRREVPHMPLDPPDCRRVALSQFQDCEAAALLRGRPRGHGAGAGGTPGGAVQGQSQGRGVARSRTTSPIHWTRLTVIPTSRMSSAQIRKAP